ncbi:unnamed protein product [Pylaiella littoralis]
MDANKLLFNWFSIIEEISCAQGVCVFLWAYNLAFFSLRWRITRVATLCRVFNLSVHTRCTRVIQFAFFRAFVTPLLQLPLPVYACVVSSFICTPVDTFRVWIDIHFGVSARTSRGARRRKKKNTRFFLFLHVHYAESTLRQPAVRREPTAVIRFRRKP